MFFNHFKEKYILTFAILLLSLFCLPGLAFATLSWNSATGASSNAWTSVTYGNGQFVAVASNGVVKTSSDGISWTLKTAPSGCWNSVAYGNGIFLAVGCNGGVMTSQDGTAWALKATIEPNSSVGPINLVSVTYGNGNFVATGYWGSTGVIMISQNGITWAQVSSVNGMQLSNVAYGAGTFVLISSGGYIETSYDGVTWTGRGAAINNSNSVWSGLSYGNGLFVAVAVGGSKKIITSTNGMTWTVRVMGVAYGLNSITFGNGLFVAVGNNSIVTSSDGINWTVGTSSTSDNWHSITYGGGVFVAVGGSGAIIASGGAVNTTYTLTYTAGAHGLITGVSPQAVNSGASGTVIAAFPSAGYIFSGWSDGLTSNPRIDTSVTKNISVTANFAAVLSSSKAITSFNIGSSIGVINNTVSITVPFGTNVSNLVPTIVISGISVSPASGVAENFTSPKTYTVTAADGSTQNYVVTVAVAAANSYTLTYTAGSNGSITGVSSQTVNSGASGTAVTAVPATGYHFVNWSDSSTANPRTDTNVTQNISVTANFVASAQGTLQIMEGAANGGSATFTYKVLPTPTTLSITVPGGSNSTTTSLSPGNYSVTQDPLSNWSLTRAICSNGTPSSFNIIAGQTTTCNFANTFSAPSGNIKIVLNAAQGDGTVFNFSDNFGLTSLTTSGGTVQWTSGPVTAPTIGFNISEIVPSNWTQTSATCDNGSPSSIQVIAGQTTTCTFMDTYSGPTNYSSQTTYTLTYTAGSNGSITGVSSQTVNSGASGTAVTAVPATGYHFVNWSNSSTANPRTDTNVTQNISVTANFVASAQGTLQIMEGAANGGSATFTYKVLPTPTTLSITVPGGSNSTTTSLSPGNYSVTQDPLSNWSLTRAICSNGTPSSFNIIAGQTTTCNFANTFSAPSGNIKIVLNAAQGDGTVFNFSDNFGLTSLTTSGGTVQWTSGPVTAPTIGFNISEIVPSNWTQTSATCDNGSPSSIQVIAGQTTTCTFMDTYSGPTNYSSQTTYTLTYTAGSNGSITGVSSQTVNSGASGTAVTAVPATGYHFVNWSNSSTANPRTDTNVTQNISVTANFVASAQGTLQIMEGAANGGSATFTYKVLPTPTTLSITVPGGSNSTTTSLSPGNYSVTQDPLSNWSLTRAICSNGTPSSFNIIAGQTTTCNFANTFSAPSGNIKIVLNAAQGDGTVFNFSDNFGLTSLTTSGGTVQWTSGPVTAPTIGFNISEIVPSNWTQTSATCDNGSPSSIQVIAGQTTTCTFMDEHTPVQNRAYQIALYQTCNIPATHNVCVNQMCTLVDAAGADECNIIGASCGGLTCNNLQQCVIGGGGASCLSNADCGSPATHTECVNSSCMSVNNIIGGDNTNQCNSDNDCSGLTCNNLQQCVIGGGGKSCSVDADCILPITHTECSNQQCITMNGPGVSQCTTDSDCCIGTNCGSGGRHNECNSDKQCETVYGQGFNQCDTNGDCDKTHNECRQSQCVAVEGLGIDQCNAAGAGCSPKHNDCNSNQQCILVDGAGSNLCQTDRDCRNTIVPPVKNNLTSILKTVSNVSDITVKSASTVGVVVGTAASASVVVLSSISFYDVFLDVVRMFDVLLGALGFTKKRKYWGVVYDSITKQPLDPAYVILKNSQGRQIASAITDINGRYGFLVDPGKYTVFPTKTNYVFPSKKLAGKSKDELYEDIYLGGAVEIKTKDDAITRNIPMDPLHFDWNQFAKQDKNIIKLYSKWNVVFIKIANVLFYLGFVLAALSTIVDPNVYTIIITFIYLLLLLLRMAGLKPRSFGFVVDKNTGGPMSFAVLRIISVNSNLEIAQKVADKYGRYYCLLPNGKYYVKIEKKNNDESYTPVYTSPVINVSKSGIIKEKFNI